MKISADIFDTYRLYERESYEVNTGFIWTQLHSKSLMPNNTKFYKGLINRKWQIHFITCRR